MTARIPLVLNAGEIQQLQSGDYIQAETDLQQTADATLIAGQVVYSTAADHIGKAQANAGASALVIGLARAPITNGAVGPVVCEGILTLTTAQWDAVFSTTGGLTFGTSYYLSAATAGLGTVTPPSTVGQYVVEIGVAVSTTELNVRIQKRILL